MQIGVNHYTLHELDEPMERKLERIALAGYDGVELGVSAHTEPVLDALATLPLSVGCVAVRKAALAANEFEEILQVAEDFDCTDIRTGRGPEHYSSREAALETAETLDRWADRAAEHGLTLHSHNHDHEFTDLGDETAFDVVVAETETIQFELDVGWAGTGGADPIELLDRIGDRVTHLHVKDMDFETGACRTFGEGDLDVEGLYETAARHDIEWGLVENDHPTDPIAELGHASLYLDQYTDHICS